MSSTRSPSKSRLPPLKALVAFEAASRRGSFALGAEELAVTPSAVSHQIQQLEDFLGVPLFQRHPGRAVLTAAGRAYAREIERAFGVIAEATNLVAPQSQRGYLVVASSPSFAAKWLQPRLPEFLRSNPDVRIRLSTLSGHDDLEATRFDIAIVYGQPHTSKFDVEPLLTERLRPLCSPVLAKELALRAPQDLARATLIHSSNALTWPEYLRQAGCADVRLDNELWLDRSVMAIDAAVDGLGVVLESELLAAQELRDGRLIAPFDGERFSVEVTSYYLVRSRDYNIGLQAATAFENWLRSAISS
ncbi:LysR substrate-binding domain-containing protein [Paraburkholderia megapolitana]|uniref:LysR family transcriptional regulator, glycine cleavage system transcriptional activator n=1 Tax=Paraburkholderia megapolitana TaxID=420953 RepID=A0A1I3J3N8_9BURK|nr:LysR substrate-binding domain-containing protein [Paraburkholderia megapolitana]QDQ84940.1 LysR family transcriptional regulator [Paraburkholderia megapolitana]SFI54872.1 LysR family transcriptional regulator, glycine cleavage system transcriptional activator [Paraburkholderia megapolitana]